MRTQGRLTEWNDDRGFGFITPLGGGPTIFVHVSKFPSMQRRPEALDLVTYLVVPDERGRPQAHQVQYLAPTRERSVRSQPHSMTLVPLALTVSSGFLMLVLAMALLGLAPWIVPGAYVVLSLVTFIAYAVDKAAAEANRWRTPESTLHMLALLGGWPGAWIAQGALRHKTIKQSFRTIFWGTVIGNVVLLAVILTAAHVPAAPG